jgi:Ca2+-binding EF-hand superfamily protein
MAETSLAPDQVEELRDAFTLFDKDGNGNISAA